jgi:hypothetical protein
MPFFEPLSRRGPLMVRTDKNLLFARPQVLSAARVNN